MRRPKPYHHGHLREVLLQAAIQLDRRSWAGRLHFAGSSTTRGRLHNAPYRHFPDREDLLAAVAAQGFRELNAAMSEAANKQPNALGQLKHAAWRMWNSLYADPNTSRSCLTRLFPGRRLRDSAEAADQAFGTLMKLVKSSQDEGRLPSGDLRQLSFSRGRWSMNLPNWRPLGVCHTSPEPIF